MKAYLSEFLGTFFLVFAGTGAIIINDVSAGAVSHVGIALTFGLVVMVLIETFGDISGAHFNPAVTFGFFLAKRFPSSRIFGYVASQLAGAIAASGTLRFLFPENLALGATVPRGDAIQSFVLEIILSMLLMLVILRMATGSKEKGLLAGIAIGGTVGLEAMFAGPICGASMNPARSIAPALVSGRLDTLWVYIAAPLIGAALGALIHSILTKNAR